MRSVLPGVMIYRYMYLVKKDGHESDCEDSSSGDELEKSLDNPPKHLPAHLHNGQEHSSGIKPLTAPPLKPGKSQEQQKSHPPPKGKVLDGSTDYMKRL